MIKKSLVIDCSPENIPRLKKRYVAVAIDVIRATTTAITAVASGRRCFFAPSIEKALNLAKKVDYPLLAGELGGNMPYGFHVNNSPVEIMLRDDIDRPLILLSTSGTPLLHQARDYAVAYVACFRNYHATLQYLIDHHNRIALIGAATRGEFREEDQMCCAWIGRGLMEAGFEPEDETTKEVICRWGSAPVEACAKGNSAEYLIKSGQTKDLQYILTHVNDLNSVYMVKNDEIVQVPSSPL